MLKLIQHIRIEALLFLAFAALIWFVMTVSATTVERQYTMNFTSDASVVDMFWMQDSTINTQVTVRSKGLSALFMRQFNGLEVPFSANNTIRANPKGLYALPEDLERILFERFGSDYEFNFTVKSDTFYFPSASLVTQSIPLRFDEQSLRLPEGYRWISQPAINPVDVEITGPEWAIPSGPITLELPQMEWKELLREHIPLPELGPLLTQSSNKVVLTAQADIWVEEHFTAEVKWEGRTHTIELWLSGPFTYLRRGEWEKHVSIALHAVEEGVGLDIDSRNSLVTVLSYAPKILVHSQE